MNYELFAAFAVLAIGIAALVMWVGDSMDDVPEDVEEDKDA